MLKNLGYIFAPKVSDVQGSIV